MSEVSFVNIEQYAILTHRGVNIEQYAMPFSHTGAYQTQFDFAGEES